MKSITVKQLFSHPIKGLTPYECDRILLTEGHGIKGDRAFALMFTDSIKAGEMPVLENIPWMSKKHFAVQNDWPLLAALKCHYQPETGILTVKREGVTVLESETKTTNGRQENQRYVGIRKGPRVCLGPCETGGNARRQGTCQGSPIHGPAIDNF